MSNFLNKLPKLSLWILFAVSIIIAALFWFAGGEQVEINGNPWDQPYFTDSLLNWAYILCGLAIVITLVISVVKFVKTFRDNPRKGLISLGVILAFVTVFVISWFLGSSETIHIIGYDGSDNTGLWAQFTDMCVFSMYILFAGTILTIIGTLVYSKIK
ncbi:MAG TPA: hypothetical protein VJ856_03220 [Paludibacteraceae bacterium]|nr:hypothetical protein [Paludibacteraceae bacterium]